jgi:PelA/Pel-15E family pectate lyase
VQPPGTPTVGEGLLEAWLTCGDPTLRSAAVDAGHHLVNGQLLSGGWDYRIETDPAKRKTYAYRIAGNPEGRNRTTLDDNTTQSALRFLMHLDRALGYRDKQVHFAVEYALDALIKAQFPNGAWPQRYEEFPDAKKFPVRKASYQAKWSRTFPQQRYYSFYTFNDNSIADVVKTMIEAREIYGKLKYQVAAEKAGDFILLAQMPDPQPAWAQQYDLQMHPAWARKFEPPSVCGGESQGVMRTLIFLYRKTGREDFLEAVPRALKYLKASEISQGRLARFYELKTNRPLYFTMKYELVYTDTDLPTHYGFQVGSKLDSIESAWRQAKRVGPSRPLDASRLATRKRRKLTPAISRRALAAITAMDSRGAWVEMGELRHQGGGREKARIISTQTFVGHIGALAAYLGSRE